MINFEVIFSYQLILLSVFISGLTHLVKGFVKSESHYWTEVILPIVPFIIGIAVGFIPSTLYPAEITSLASRVVFCGVAGLVSGAIWRAVNALLAGGAPDA